MLNFFPETGDDFVADGGTCSFYNDRAGNKVTVNSCNGNGPRGAANDENLLRQRAKIVAAINTLGADVLSLEEIENSAQYAGPDRRDDALSSLVDALNAAAGSAVWKFVPSPAPADRPAVTDEDVIRTAFIYKQAKAAPVGTSHILQDPAFDNAREPLAQAFRPADGTAAQDFLVIVNHFKSKGSGVDDGTGQGNANPDRVAQAKALVTFADQQKQLAGTDLVFLTGDFNSYTQEDPLQVLYDAGYTDIGADQAPEEYTYQFGGTVGSLDHVLANGPALAQVTGAHVWNINSVESVAYEYSRFNYNATSFYAADPYRSSDHDPLLVGFDVPAPPAATTTTATVSPKPVVVRDTTPTLTARVAGDGGTVDGGTVTFTSGGTVLGTAPVGNGVATLTLPAYQAVGAQTVTASFGGTSAFAPSSADVAFDVVKATPRVDVRRPARRDPQDDDQPAARRDAERRRPDRHGLRRRPAERRDPRLRAARRRAHDDHAGAVQEEGPADGLRAVPRQRPRRGGDHAGHLHRAELTHPPSPVATSPVRRGSVVPSGGQPRAWTAAGSTTRCGEQNAPSRVPSPTSRGPSSTSATTQVTLSTPPAASAASTSARAASSASGCSRQTRTWSSSTRSVSPSEQTSSRSPGCTSTRPTSGAARCSASSACRTTFLRGCRRACSRVITPCSTSSCTKVWSRVSWVREPSRSR